MSRSCSMDSHKGRCPATAKVGPVEVLGAFDLAAGPHIGGIVMVACRQQPILCSTSLFFKMAEGAGPMAALFCYGIS